MTNLKHIILSVALGGGFLNAYAEGKFVSEHVWLQFSSSEQINLLKSHKDLKIIPDDGFGLITGAQLINRSTSGNNAGSDLGSALAQARYIDKTFDNNYGADYSASKQIGAGLAGAIVGSVLNAESKSLFEKNYGLKMINGSFKELNIRETSELTKPIGQCVFIPSFEQAPSSLCDSNKTSFLKYLSSADQGIKDKNVNCRINNIGLMTLPLTACADLNGVVE